MRLATVIIKVEDTYMNDDRQCLGCPFDTNDQCNIVVECPIIQKDAVMPSDDEEGAVKDE